MFQSILNLSHSWGDLNCPDPLWFYLKRVPVHHLYLLLCVTYHWHLKIFDQRQSCSFIWGFLCVCLSFCKSGVNSDRENLMPDWKNSIVPQHCILCGHSAPPAGSLLYQKEIPQSLYVLPLIFVWPFAVLENCLRSHSGSGMVEEVFLLKTQGIKVGLCKSTSLPGDV